MAVQQCARFSNDPQLIHERYIQKIGKYLSETATRCIIYDSDKTQGIECYVDVEYSVGWERKDGQWVRNVLSRSGYAIFYAGCPVLWESKLQTEFALSTAEAEYIALYTALLEVIPFMYLLKELPEVIELNLPTPKKIQNI